MKKRVVLAADLGGTNLRMAVVNESGKIMFRESCITPFGEGRAGILKLIIELAEKCRRISEKFGDVKALGIAVPGTVNAAKGIILKAPNVAVLDNFFLAKSIRKKLHLECFMENDANAAAIGESWLGASKKNKNSIFITLGTGIGGGIIIGGNILNGIDGTAGEIGHVCVEPFGVPCGCGSNGCLEQYSSATAIVRLAREMENKYPKSNLLKDKSLSSFKIYQAAKTGDELALEVFRKQGFYLGIAIGGLLNVLNTEIVVIGGGVAAAWDLFAPEMIKQIHLHSYREPAKRAKIVRAECGDDAGIVGAAIIAFSKIAER